MKHQLPPDVAAKYSCTQEPTRVRLPQPFDREIDLRTMSLEEADYVHDTGLGILVLKPVPKAKKESSGTQG